MASGLWKTWPTRRAAESTRPARDQESVQRHCGPAGGLTRRRRIDAVQADLRAEDASGGIVFRFSDGKYSCGARQRARGQCPAVPLRPRTPAAREREREGAGARAVAHHTRRGPWRSHPGMARRQALSRPPRLTVQSWPHRAVDEGRLRHRGSTTSRFAGSAQAGRFGA